ncbi:alpha-tectorin-like [Trachinotus anak]|uniref:alpha-tectorin-like n=1 Tax=Trachinotus anak TaxID=443729 RepID=UPI0039F22C4A
MLFILFYLAALSQTAAAEYNNISSCPITYFGRQYTALNISISNDRTAVCFKGMNNEVDENDCLLLNSHRISVVDTNIINSDKGPGSDFHSNLRSLTGSSTCAVALQLKDASMNAIGYIEFRMFTTQTMKFYDALPPFNVEIQVSGRTRETVTISESIYRNIHACSQGCRGTENICTVNSVIGTDFAGQLFPIRNRCAYSLISYDGFQLVGINRERRRKDINFLDQLILVLEETNVTILMGQGGRVQVNNTELSLDTSPVQLIGGVELSKDQTGVTARLISSNTSVFFNDYTAQIHMRGINGTVQGLCGQKTSGDFLLPEYSSPGCEVPYSDLPDPTINHTQVTEHCAVLNVAPFTACHQYVNPEAFIASCMNILYQYPAVDGFSQCQFLEAYTRACSIQGNINLQGWRSNVNCSDPPVSCQGTFCGPNEFCSVDVSGKTSCLCRAIFASTLPSRDAFGEPTVCNQSSASVTLVGCLLAERGIDYTALHLNEPSCRGHVDNQTRTVTFSFDNANTCGTVVMANNSHLIYKNSIRIHNDTGIITRQDQIQVDFSCYYTQPDMKAMSFRIQDSSVIEQIVSGVWNYTLTMKAYTDPAHTQAIEPSTRIQLQQTVWVELKTEGLDSNLVALVIDSCWATDQPSSNGSLRYNLIMNGCANPTDNTVRVMNNGLGTSNYFSFSMFQFTGSSSDVYLHCRLNLCARLNRTCAPSCGVRRRRSARRKYEDENPAVITMAWKN